MLELLINCDAALLTSQQGEGWRFIHYCGAAEERGGPVCALASGSVWVQRWFGFDYSPNAWGMSPLSPCFIIIVIIIVIITGLTLLCWLSHRVRVKVRYEILMIGVGRSTFVLITKIERWGGGRRERERERAAVPCCRLSRLLANLQLLCD